MQVFYSTHSCSRSSSFFIFHIHQGQAVKAHALCRSSFRVHSKALNAQHTCTGMLYTHTLLSTTQPLHPVYTYNQLVMTQLKAGHMTVSLNKQKPIARYYKQLNVTLSVRDVKQDARAAKCNRFIKSPTYCTWIILGRESLKQPNTNMSSL